jgi:hypothetical protein
VAGGRWPVAGGRWPVAGGRWQVAGGQWPVAGSEPCRQGATATRRAPGVSAGRSGDEGRRPENGSSIEKPSQETPARRRPTRYHVRSWPAQPLAGLSMAAFEVATEARATGEVDQPFWPQSRGNRRRARTSHSVFVRDVAVRKTAGSMVWTRSPPKGRSFGARFPNGVAVGPRSASGHGPRQSGGHNRSGGRPNRSNSSPVSSCESR